MVQKTVYFWPKTGRFCYTGIRQLGEGPSSTTTNQPCRGAMRITGFEPICALDARVLILGTMPGKESLRVGEYYANPRNSFWGIVGELLGFSIEADYGARVESLKSHGIALWDVLAIWDRDGSLDSKIRMSTAIPNRTIFRRF